MGGAYTAIADDAYAAFWNSAGCSRKKERSFEYSASFILLYEDINIFNSGLKIITNRYGGFNLAGAFLAAEDIYRDEFGEEGDKFAINDLVISISYAYPLNKRISLGGGGKIFYSRLADYTTYSTELDLGVLINLLKYLHLGGAIRNIGRGTKFYIKTDPSPTTGTIGVSGRLPFLYSGYDFGGLTLAYDMEISIDRGLSHLIGGEFYIKIPKKLMKKEKKGTFYKSITGLALRGGHRSGYQLGKWSGLSYGMMVEFTIPIIRRRTLLLQLDIVGVNYGCLGNAKHIALNILF
jgi:hypothetical protein